MSEGKRMSVEEYKYIFGIEPTDTLLEYVTTHIKRLVKNGHTTEFVIDRIGMDWLNELLRYNERVEQYETCSLLHGIINNKSKKHKTELL